jgi:hypothetical protein
MTLTHFLAQAIGLFCLVLGASLFRKKIFTEVVDDIVANRALLYLVGVISLGLGLMVVPRITFGMRDYSRSLSRSSVGLWC